MWPWEHLAFGYVAFGTTLWIGKSSTPTGQGAVALAVGTQFPDIVDKPLSWTFSILPSGTSLAHSVLVAVPVVVLVLVVCRRLRRIQVGVGFGIGYLSHLAGDVVYPVAIGGKLSVGHLLWPLVSTPGPERSGSGFFTRATDLVWQYLTFLGTPRGVTYLLAELALLLGGFLLWRSHGYPGLRTTGHTLLPK